VFRPFLSQAHCLQVRLQGVHRRFESAFIGKEYQFSGTNLMLFSDALTAVTTVAPLKLEFKQFGFHLIARVLRNSDFSIFSSLSALPICYCPRCLSTQGKSVDP
jgi:hypothetical protein